MDTKLNSTPTNNLIIMPDSPMIADQRGIGHVYFASMLKYREKIAQVDGHTNEEETYESLLKRSIRTSITMQNMGIKPGDFVSMCTVNDMDACIVYFASLFIGAIMANVDVNMSSQEIVFFLKQVSPKIIFVTPNSEIVIEEVIRELGGQITLVVFGESELNLRFADFMRRYENEDKFKPREVDNLEETAFVVFSSGTTDRPKGICHSHLSMVSHNYEKEGCDTFAIFHSPRLSLFNRFIHDTIRYGFKRVLFRSFDLEDPWKILNYKVDFTLFSPIASRAFLKIKKPEHLDLENLKMMMIGGNHSSKEHIMSIRTTLPKTNVVQGYGQTEIFSRILQFSEDQRGLSLSQKYPDSVGRPLKGICYKVVNVETEEVLGPNQEGELRLKTKYLMKGYYNYESTDTLDSDGWYRTGDLAYYNEDRCFFITGRAKESFKYRHHHIYPKEIEDVLLTHRSIQNAAVVSVAHEKDGYQPIAIVELNTNEPEVTPEEIMKYVEERVDDKYRLRGGVKIIKQFPLTPSLKINLFKLKEMLKHNLI